MSVGITGGFDPGAIEPAAQEALAEIAEATAERIRDNVPVRSGKLRDSIKADDQGNVTSSADYALAIEHGTVHTPAQPYIDASVREADPAQIAATILERRL